MLYSSGLSHDTEMKLPEQRLRTLGDENRCTRGPLHSLKSSMMTEQATKLDQEIVK
jgi:hypothetical protein